MRQMKAVYCRNTPPVVLNERSITGPHPSTIHQVAIIHEQPTHLPTTHTSSIHTPTPTIDLLKTTNHQRPTHLSLIHSSTHHTKIHYCTHSPPSPKGPRVLIKLLGPRAQNVPAMPCLLDLWPHLVPDRGLWPRGPSLGPSQNKKNRVSN